jgi:hypothetical protein
MKNVEMSVEGSVLTIRVDLSQEFGPSSTGKTIIIASTEGNVTIPSHLALPSPPTRRRSVLTVS